MNSICDAVTVLGARHGLLLNPVQRECRVIRFDTFNALPRFSLHAGIRFNGREVSLPLSPNGEKFAFVDQRLTPCESRLIGIDPPSGLRLELSVVTPFKPRDAAFSTTPVVGIRVTARRLETAFRLETPSDDVSPFEVFLEFSGEQVSFAPSREANALTASFTSRNRIPADEQPEKGPVRFRDEELPQTDAIVGIEGARTAQGFQAASEGEDAAAISVCWCSWSGPVLQYGAERLSFRYALTHGSLAEVTDWARNHSQELWQNAKNFERVIEKACLGGSTLAIMAQSLHSWLACTWWTRAGNRELFTVWEGSCGFHSTVDVEFTQSPFYLSVWPELLEYQLDHWPSFLKDAANLVVHADEPVAFLSHDIGGYGSICGQVYHHEMEVEETCNFLILAAVHWRRTGNDRIIRQHQDAIERLAAFLRHASDAKRGYPVMGTSNTVDDAAAALQNGAGQVYLAVKALAAHTCSALIFDYLQQVTLAEDHRCWSERLRQTLQRDGWCEDHFPVLLDAVDSVVNPWTGESEEAAVEAARASHIFTANALPLLDMVGIDLGLDADRVKTDLWVATERCLREYGCVHTNYAVTAKTTAIDGLDGVMGITANPGWISMNILRDLAAFYRGVDLRYLADRYWNWQLTTNAQEPKLFFETFGGNDLHHYPRGIVSWGILEALGGVVIEQVEGRYEAAPEITSVRVPVLFFADWETGESPVVLSGDLEYLLSQRERNAPAQSTPIPFVVPGASDRRE